MIHYFVYKNGLGNYFTPLTCAEDGRVREKPVLYVGFDKVWPVEPGETLSATEENGGETPHPWKLDDLNHIRFVSHEKNRAEFILLTFEKTVLRFWRVVGPVRVATHAELSVAKQIGGKRAKEYVHHLESEPILPLRVLPVSLVAEVPRDVLYTSVDSLASYQYLIRGTCRPLWRATGPTAAEHEEDVLEASRNLVPRCSRIGKETPFGAFVRLYLNEVLHRRGTLPPQAEGARLRVSVGDDEPRRRLGRARQIVMASLNPILVETAALAFVQDLGLTPDIGVGKGKDVIDVRGRAASTDGSFSLEAAERARDRLDQLAEHVEYSDVLRLKLMHRGTLDIQCKAADRGKIPEGILYFGFKAKNTVGADLLLLNDIEALVEGGEWPALKRFLVMQARILMGDWRLKPSSTPTPTVSAANGGLHAP